MSVTKLLIANRGEIAIRIARAVADMGLPIVAAYSEDDSRSLHLRVADECQALPGRRDRLSECRGGEHLELVGAGHGN